MGILVNGGDDSSLRVEMPNGDASKMRVPTSRARAWGHPMFLGTRFAVEAGAPDAARGADMAWHVTLKVLQSFPPTHHWPICSLVPLNALSRKRLISRLQLWGASKVCTGCLVRA